MNHTNTHFSESELLSFIHNELDADATIEILEHLSTCDTCSGLYGDLLMQSSLISAPHYMKSALLEQVARQNEIANITMRSQLSARKQLFFYSLRVTAAMCGALFFLFSGTLSAHNSITPKINTNIATDTLTQMHDRFSQFTNIITLTEDPNYDQETK